MFEQLETGFSYGSTVFQIIVAYIAAYVTALSIGSAYGGPDSPALAVLTYSGLTFAAAALSFAISLISPSSSREGRWIWVVPMTFELLFVTLLAADEPSHLLTVIYVGPENGEDGWGMFLLTTPAWFFVSYSATMQWRYRSAKLRGATTMTSG
jgi:hypothetical protein